LNIEDYDSFFNLFKQKIQPLFPKITNNKLPKFLFSEYDISKQKEFINELMDYLQVDKKTFYCAETEHPFSSSMTNTDVRFAVKYTSNNFFDCIFSAIHEIGHSFFQAYIDKKFIFTPIETNISMGLHESQSRFLENYIAKRKSF
jgi:carboxypeptidase Taq